MTEPLRTPFFIVSLVLLAIVVLVEIGATFAIGEVNLEQRDIEARIAQQAIDSPDDFKDIDATERRQLAGQLLQLRKQGKAPGLAIAYLALLDGLVLFTVGLIGLSLLVPASVHGRVQGCATLIVSLLVILGGIVLAFAAFALVMLMISLLLSVPFGTLAYIAKWGFFQRDGASIALALLMALKLGAIVFLILAHQRFLQNTGLVLILLFSVIDNVIVGFLQGFVPGLLVSITDGIAAIVLAIIAIIWAIIMLIGSLPAIIKALRIDRALKS